MNETRKRAILVCAVSTVEQAKDDKESMPAQERELTAIAAAENWDIVDIIRIPGFSRSYFTLRELVVAAELQNEHGPKQLEDHIIAGDFDVMAVRSTNRFNREPSLNAEVIGKVIKVCKAEIYSVMDGWINKQNRRAMTAITGFRDGSEIDELVKKRAVGIVGRLKRGLPISGKLPFSHHIVRDPLTGKDIRADLNEDLRPLFNDLAAVLLEQVPYEQIERVLFERYGHVNSGGRPYLVRSMYKFLLSPYTWGNNIIRWKGQSKPWSIGLWAFDPDAPAPEGVSLVRGTHPPVYSGELAESVQAELRRRAEVSNRASLKVGVKLFAGLVVCDYCGWRYGYNITTNRYGTTYKYLRCHNAASNRFGYTPCQSVGQISEADVLAFLNDHLRDALEQGYPSFSAAPAGTGSDRELASLKASARQLERRLDSLMEELASADADLKADYRRKIRATKDEYQRAIEQANSIEARLSHDQRANASRDAVLDRIRAATLEGFWSWSATDINRELRSYLIDYRIVARDRDILGFTPLSAINQGRRRKLV